MIPADADPVFGRGALRIATGEHVEVVREATPRTGQRCFSKHFLATATGDFRVWTERERRAFEQLDAAGAAVARLAPPRSRGGDAGPAELRTVDAGPTVDQWATRIVLRRGGKLVGNVFEDCACWWALAQRCLLALEPLHALGVVHLDLKADNICIPWPRAASSYPVPGQPMLPCFEDLALIDLAFALVPGLDFPAPLPLARQPDYEYQSPRLLQALDDGHHGDLAATLALDWRADLFSLAALLWRYLPEEQQAPRSGWTVHRRDQATAFVRLLLECDGAELPAKRPHAELAALAGQRLAEPEIAAALNAGCTFDSERAIAAGADPVPATRIHREPRPQRVAAPVADGATAAPVAASREAPVPAQPVAVDFSPATVTTDQSRDARRRVKVGVLAALASTLVAAAAAWWWLDAPARRGRESAQARIVEAVTSARPAASEVAAATPEPEAAPSPASPVASAPPEAVLAAAAPASAPDIAAPEPSPAASAPGPTVVAAAEGTPAAQAVLAQIPVLADGAERRLAPVLALAGQAGPFRPARDVRAAARAARSPPTRPTLPVPADSAQARRWNEAARLASARDGPGSEALRLQTQAFDADPLDPEIAGNLAYYRLREAASQEAGLARPGPNAEPARQLALYALTLQDRRFPSGRVQDWTTLAIASALSGRDADAKSAWAVTLALADDVPRHCAAAVRAEAVYGERVRPSVQALIERAGSSAAYRRCTGAAPERTSAKAAAAPARARATGASSRNDSRAKRVAPRQPRR